VAHRKRILKYATKLCVIRDGTQAIFGPAKTVAEKLMAAANTKQDRKVSVRKAPVETDLTIDAKVTQIMPHTIPPLLDTQFTAPPIQSAPVQQTAMQKPPMPKVPQQAVMMNHQPAVTVMAPNAQPEAIKFNVPPNPYLRSQGVN